jgi:general secretion pathway protein J
MNRAFSKSHNRTVRFKQGFTLLELLISLSILAVIVVIIFAAFRIGIRAWEKGEAAVDDLQRKRIVLSLIKQQLASIFPKTITKEAKQQVLFKGDAKSILFVSALALMKENDFGAVLGTYRIIESDEDTEAITFFETSTALMDPETVEENLDQDAFVTLVPSAKKVVFEYLKKDETDETLSEWQEAWDPEVDGGLPLAVKMTFQNKADEHPIRVITRLADFG